jgi:hypothetical protein
MKTKSVFLLVVLGLVVVHSVVFAQGIVTFYTNEAAWLAAVTNVETFPFTASNVAKSNEVTSPPGNNADLGTSTLTFSSTNTGLSRSFTLQALQSGATLVYNDGDLQRPSISIGRGNVYEDDDWQVTITSGCPLTAFAFDLVGNATNTGESFSVYGPGNVLLGSTTPPTSSNQGSAFLGVVSTSPIVRLHYDEGASGDNGDDIGVANFRFAVNEAVAPAVLILTPPTAVNPVGTMHTVTATVRDATGRPVSCIRVLFMVTRSAPPGASGSCSTDAMGQCNFMYPGPQQPDTDVIIAFADTNNNGVQDEGEPDGEATKTWVPVTAQATLTPAAAVNSVGTSHTVTATVTNTVGQPMQSVAVRFTVVGSVSPTGSCTTNANGQCTFTYAGPQLPGADLITAYPDLNNNMVQDLNELEGAATKAWLLPTSTPGLVTGGGHILSASPPAEVAFGFNAQNTASGFSGHCNVIDPSTQPRTHLKCVDVTALVQTPLLTGGGTATFFGNATVNGVPTTYRIDVADVAEPGTGGDTFSIQTNSGYTAAGPLTRGNIQVHR